MAEREKMKLGIELSDEELMEMTGGETFLAAGTTDGGTVQPLYGITPQPLYGIQPLYGVQPLYGIQPLYGVQPLYGIQPLYGVQPMYGVLPTGTTK